MDDARASLAHRALAAVALFTLLAGDTVRYALSWWGFGAVALAGVVAVVVVLVRAGVAWRRIPPSFIVFHLLTAASIIWSYYPGVTAAATLVSLATTAAALFLATQLEWREFVRVLRGVLGVILAASLLFEVVVAAVLRGPLLPFWVDYSSLDRVPPAFYWSRGLLFEGGRIQGIVGNANLLGMLALLALIVFGAALLSRLGTRLGNVVGLLLAVACLTLAGSGTVLVALAITVFVIATAVVTSRVRGAARIAVPAAAGAVAVAAVAAVIVFRDDLLSLLGRSADLTNRLDIWRIVLGLVEDRPVAGWGWVGYWYPFVEPFDDLLVYGGVTYYQAHNAWLDVLFQLGVLGLVVFALAVIGVGMRLWLGAIEAGRPILDGVLPLALLAALLAQSLAESRLLVEGGWALLLVLAIRSTDRLPSPASALGRTSVSGLAVRRS